MLQSHYVLVYLASGQHQSSTRVVVMLFEHLRAVDEQNSATKCETRGDQSQESHKDVLRHCVCIQTT